MSQRLDTRFAALKAQGRPALASFTMVYDPDRDTAQSLLNALPAAGVDVIELGIPFSDPVADGATIQLAGQRALKAGATLRGALETVAEFRRHDNDTPIVLMGYYNPFFRYGAAFCAEAAAAGVDGVIIADLPAEEQEEIRPAADAAGLALIPLVAPTTGDARLATLLAQARGFIYFIAVAGVTGSKSADLSALEQNIARVRTVSDLPLMVGFGIRTPEQAAAIARLADGIIVGSAIVDVLHREGQEAALQLVSRLADAAHTARQPA